MTLNSSCLISTTKISHECLNLPFRTTTFEIYQRVKDLREFNLRPPNFEEACEWLKVTKRSRDSVLINTFFKGYTKLYVFLVHIDKNVSCHFKTERRNSLNLATGSFSIVLVYDPVIEKNPLIYRTFP
jgi:hypothetical protein